MNELRNKIENTSVGNRYSMQNSRKKYGLCGNQGCRCGRLRNRWDAVLERYIAFYHSQNNSWTYLWTHKYNLSNLSGADCQRVAVCSSGRKENGLYQRDWIEQAYSLQMMDLVFDAKKIILPYTKWQYYFFISYLSTQCNLISWSFCSSILYIFKHSGCIILKSIVFIKPFWYRWW